MASAENLVALFDAIAQNLEQDRTQLNALDGDDGDVGDNMAGNFQLIRDTLADVVAQSGPQADAGVALRRASKKLREQGRGATAPIYAEGLEEAGRRLEGTEGFSLEQLAPLLEGLLSGTRQASGAQPGQGSMIDVLLPGILAYVQARDAGGSETQALLQALLQVRRAASGTATTGAGFGRQQGSDTTGRIDPGAAGAASLLEGLFGALLQGALQQGASHTAPRPAQPQGQPQGGDLFSMLGQLFRG